LNRNELLSLLDKISQQILKKRPKEKIRKQNLITVGMVGYPNVGKSSVINVLFEEKKVGIGSIPGKTKHFQTLFLNDDLMLCDCPGLVFPQIAFSKAHMYCNGVLSIESLRDHIEPVKIIIKAIPKQVFES